MEVEASYTYDHLDPKTFTDGKFYFMIIPSLYSFDKKIQKLKEKIDKDISGKIKRLKRTQNKLKEIDYKSSEDLEGRILELEKEKEEQKKAKEETNKSYNRTYEEYILGHIAKFKEYAIDCLKESISSIQDSIKDKKLELEELRRDGVQKDKYSKLFKP